MPRGVAIPEVRQQLFAAAESVILRDGVARLRGRAVTDEAGVATGLLYAHFADFDDFVYGYAVDRQFQLSAGAAALRERVGAATVVENLCAAVEEQPPVAVIALTRLLAARPDVGRRIEEILGERTAGFDALEDAVAAYLAAERDLGRLAATADPGVLAFTVVAVVHRLVLNADDPPAIGPELRRQLTHLLRGFASAGTPSEADVQDRVI
ncbi:TetR family transcriptional regulator [Nocardia puris]|uniref:TetR family transcriptional regulator n=1 Tax=Nocardia puris TaxID=208602 RepID=A0A366E127_9NOCA|nr:TetR family transcriptional regulator [Nocardia puris]MBF6209725.1 TetR family transcriptional regulator [Nocardia puris]MBF6366297.1 TetR family transcriptional regulator [Nocardia puris]MBF6458364.1 TetR family transcriptional regulator [Nocardia puris]RBO96013.1 TetR family transcriptional regulator [Nocardia puris]